MRIVLAATLLTALLSGCSSTKFVSTAPGPPVTALTPQQAGGALRQPAAATAQIDVGTTVELHPASGPLDVTVLKVVEPATATNPQIKPASGQRWIAVEFRFANRGSTAFDNNLYTLAGLDSQGRTLQIDLDVQIAAGPTIPLLSGLHLAPGDSQTGFVVFEVPKGTELNRVQYSPAGAGVARWTVG